MNEIIIFYNNYYDRAINLKKRFRMIEKNNWTSIIVLNELFVQMGHLCLVCSDTKNYKEIGRKIESFGDELSDVILQLTSLMWKLEINYQELKSEKLCITFTENNKYLSEVYILLGQITEAVLETENYRFKKPRKGYNTNKEFIITKISLVLELVFSLANKNHINLNKEFEQMLVDANKF